MRYKVGMVLHEQHIDLRQITTAVGLLASIVEGSHDAIIAKNLDGVIISWNPAAERLFGYLEADAVGQHVSMLIPDNHRGEDEVVMGRILSGATVEHYETERLAKDGRLIAVSLTVSALRGIDGAVIGASKIMRDITPQLEALRMQRRLAAVVESTDDAVIVKDREGTITSWNPAAERMFGYAPDEAIGQHISLLFPPDMAGSERDILGEILEGRKVDHYETTRMTRDGRRIDVSLTVSPLRDETGVIVGASKVVRDVSERRRSEAQAGRAADLARANAQLAAADRLKDQLLAMANHELRTPLTSIAGFTRTLIDLEDRITDAQRREFLEIISSQTDRLARLVEDMLDLSRVELGKVHPRAAEIDVLELARDTLRNAGHDRVEVVADQACIRARVDAHHFEQMLLNYVDNAHKYGEAPVRVVFEESADSVVVAVCDAGSGVDPSFEPRLFERFSRGERGVNDGTPGTGLGLAIVQGLARAQGGDAWYERADGGNARFCLRLPQPTNSLPA
jgi:PAS domain S-box-containing protein